MYSCSYRSCCILWKSAKKDINLCREWVSSRCWLFWRQLFCFYVTLLLSLLSEETVGPLVCKQPIRRTGLRGDCEKQQKIGKKKKSKTQKEVLIRRIRRKRHPVKFSENSVFSHGNERNSGLLVSEREVTQTGDRGLTPACSRDGTNLNSET